MNILAYLRHYPPPFDGGAYNYNWHLIEEIRNAGIHITVLTHQEAKPVNLPGFRVIHVQSIKTGRYHYTSRLHQIQDIFLSIFSIRKALAEARFDFILTDAGYIQNLIVHLGNFPGSTPVIGINFSEEISSVQTTTSLRARLQTWLLKKHVCNLVISKATEKMLVKLGVQSPIVLVHPCVDEQPFLEKEVERKKLLEKFGFQEKELILGFLGRLVKRKGIANLIFAVKELRKKGSKVNLLIAGQGEEQKALQELIKTEGCSDFCIMIGLLPEKEKASFLCGLDLFAMPNYTDPQTGDSEGFGIVFLEAAQQGTPVIGGRDGGVPDAISDGFNGFIVNGDCIESITKAVERYYLDLELRLFHGNNGKIWATTFNWNDQTKPFLQFINYHASRLTEP